MREISVFLLLFEIFRLQELHCYVIPETSSDTIIEFAANNSTSISTSQENTWECSKDNNIREKQLTKALEMIRDGDKAVSGDHKKIQNMVIVLGNPGVGKTTFVQFMAGNNSGLISKEVGDGTGEYVIEDGKKIGSSVTDSQTMYPEYLEYTDGSVLCDTPGFSDTRSPMHEIIAAYAMKKYLMNVENVKIVLLAHYNILQYGMFKNNFVDLLRNLNNFIGNISVYKERIALIATKVPSIIRKTKDGFVEVTDINIIKSIAEFLSKIKLTFEEKLKQQDDPRERTFLENAIQLISSLQEVDKDGHYKKINLFHRPTVPGPLQDIADFQKGKESLKKTLESLEYIKLEDFSYKLSGSGKNYLYCLLTQLDNNIKNTSQIIFQKINNYYKVKLETFSSIHMIINEFESTIKELEELKNDLDYSKGYNDYIGVLKQFNEDHGILIDRTENDTISQIFIYINELKRFIDTGSLIVPTTWTFSMKPLLENIKEEKKWYQFLIKAYEKLSTYSIQKSRTLYLDTFDFNETENQISIKNSLMKVFSAGVVDIDHDIKHYINNFVLDQKKVIELNNIVSFCLNTLANVNCSDGNLIIRGNYVKLSEINDKTTKENMCGTANLKSVNVFAVRTVFIDDDILDDGYRGINMIIAAPIWEVVGGKIIALNGIEGKSHNNSKAENGKEFGENGVNGSPGFPGGNGGNFIGVGLEFINGAGLKIQVNGGVGGQGQSGGDGRIGSNGINGSQVLNIVEDNKFKEIVLESEAEDSPFNLTFSSGYLNFSNAIRDRGYIYMIDVHNKCASNLQVAFRDGSEGKVGGNGGDGGVGGFGGYEGSAKIIAMKENSGIHIEIKSGNRGIPGTGGIGGETGVSGDSVACYHLTITNKAYGPTTKHFWRCVKSSNEARKYCPVSSLPGRTGSVEAGILKPPERKPYDYSYDLINYSSFLEENKDNKLVSLLIYEFHEKVLKKLAAIKKKHHW